MRVTLLILLCCAACRSVPAEPKNPFVLERPWGIATGATAEQALVLAELVEVARPRLVELPGFVDQPLRIHASERALPHDWSGMTVAGVLGGPWVVIASGTAYLPFATTHELAHFYLGELVGRLPPVVEEGFCDLVAKRIHPAPDAESWRLTVAAVSYLDRFTIRIDGPGAKARLGYLVQEVPALEAVLELDAAEFLKLDERARDACYGIGWVVADALGFEGLAELEARRRSAGLERIPVAWILEASGLAPLTQANLTAAFVHALGAEPGPRDGTLTITLSDG